jgi:hypothetical protein
MQLNIVKKSFALLQKKKNSMQKIIIQESSRLKHYVRKLPLTVTCKVSKTWPCLQERLMQCCNLPLISALSFHFCGCKHQLSVAIDNESQFGHHQNPCPLQNHQLQPKLNFHFHGNDPQPKDTKITQIFHFKKV